jgi:hypothetical protein
MVIHKGKSKGETEGRFDRLHTMTVYGTMKLQLHLSLNLVLDGGEWWSSRSYCLTAGERSPVAIEL